MKLLKTLLQLMLISMLAFSLVDCAGKDKGSGSVDEEDALSESMSDEEKSELRERKKKQTGDHGKLGKFLKEKRYTELEQEATKILGVNPKDLRALAALGLMNMQRGRFGAARIFFERALKDHPDEAGIYNNLGVMLIKEGELVAGYKAFAKAYDLNSSNPNILANLGSIFVKYMDYVEAEPLVEDAYNNLSNNVIVANNYAIILRTQGRFEEAEKIYKKALAKDPRNIPTNLNYAILLVDYMKNYSKARQIANKLEFLNPTDRYTLNKIAELQKKVNTAGK